MENPFWIQSILILNMDSIKTKRIHTTVHIQFVFFFFRKTNLYTSNRKHQLHNNCIGINLIAKAVVVV